MNQSSNPQQALTLNRRKGFGTQGRPFGVLVNCFELTRTPDGTVYFFDVSFSDSQVKEKRQIITYLIEKENVFGPAGQGAVYDGRANLYLHGNNPWGSETSKVFQVSENQARGRPMRPDRPIEKNLGVKITLAKTLNMQALSEYVAGRASQSNELQEAINAMNIAIKHAPYSIFPNKKNSFYVPPEGNQRMRMSGGLEAYAAYFSSIRPGIQRVIMNFDRGVGTFKQSGNVIDILLQFVERRDPRDLELSRMPPAVAAKVKKFLKGFMVKLSVGRDQTKTFKIRKVSDMSAAQFMFEVDAGQRTNVQAYIESKYNIKLQHPYLPCVQLTKIAWYPLEMVALLPGSMSYGKLNPKNMQEMLKFATQRPREKFDAIREGLNYMKFGSPTLRQWNLDVKISAPIKARARLLDPPKLHFSQGGQPKMVDVQDGQWRLGPGIRGYRQPIAPIDRWFVVVFASQHGQRGFNLSAAQNAVGNFVKACSQYGIPINLERPKIHYADDCNGHEVAGHLKDVAKSCGYGKNNPPQLVLTFVQEKTSRQYPFVKLATDTTFGVPSQNLVIATLIKQKGPSYYSNVALKVNVKLQGGVNQIIAKPVKLPGFDQPTIIFGADVSHPGPGSVFPSIAAVVASCDSNGVKYNTSARVQTSREEIIIELKDMAMELIKKFVIMNKTNPARLIFYRDGVSEGQFDEVCRREISALKGACEALGRGINPQVTYIIAGKRHHIRFFAPDPKDGDRNGNAKAGTCVDNDITHPYYNDFFLCSHQGLLGTSKPTHYSVLLDENNFNPDDMQRLTFWLSHIYPRATRSVSIAAPAYYAHHLATRAKMYIGEDDTASALSAGATPDQIDAMREQTLQRARASFRRAMPELDSTFYFM